MYPVKTLNDPNKHNICSAAAANLLKLATAVLVL